MHDRARDCIDANVQPRFRFRCVNDDAFDAWLDELCEAQQVYGKRPSPHGLSTIGFAGGAAQPVVSCPFALISNPLCKHLLHLPARTH